MRAPASGQAAPRPAADGASPPAAYELWVIGLALLLGVAVPLGVWHGTAQDVPHRGTLPLVLLTVGSGLRLAVLCAVGRPRFLTMLYYVFLYIWLSLAPLLRVWSGRLIADPATLWRAAGLVVLGTVGFEIGGRLWQRRSPRSEGEGSWFVLSVPRVALLAAGSIVITAFLVGFLVSMDARLLFSSWTELTEVLQRATGSGGQERFQLFLKGMRVPPFVSAYLLYLLLIQRWHARSHRWNLLLGALLVGNLAFVVLTSNPVTSPRHWFGTVGLSFVFAELCRRRAWATRIGVLWVLGLILALFPYADFFRSARGARDIEPSPMDAMASKLDYDAFDQIVAAFDFVGDYGHTRGRQVLGAATFWVPRIWWPEKPLPSGQVVAEAYRRSFTNVSMPLWGEAYLDGGWALAVVYFLLLGWACGWLERGLEVWRSESDLRLAGVLGPLCAAYLLFLLRGALMVAVAYLAPVVALIILCVRRARLPAEASTAYEGT